MNRTTRVVGTVAASALVLPLSVALAAPAAAAPSAKGACVQAGVTTLKEAGALQAAAQKKVDYSTLVAVPEGTFLPLGQVVKLHTTTPELFPWC